MIKQVCSTKNQLTKTNMCGKCECDDTIEMKICSMHFRHNLLQLNFGAGGGGGGGSGVCVFFFGCCLENSNKLYFQQCGHWDSFEWQRNHIVYFLGHENWWVIWIRSHRRNEIKIGIKFKSTSIRTQKMVLYMFADGCYQNGGVARIFSSGLKYLKFQILYIIIYMRVLSAEWI